MRATQEGYKAYPKIHRLGKDETIGLIEELPVVVQEKIDGANISIFELDGKLRCGTRTRMLPEDESFNGFQEAVQKNGQLAMWFSRNPDCILYGEWLVRHTIAYPETAYRKIYLFDIFDTTTGKYWDQAAVKEEAEFLGLEYPTVFLEEGKYTEEQIKEHVGKSEVGPQGEGVVIKSTEFVNKYGDHAYAKIVTEKFKEDNGLIFGGNNKHSDTYWEMYIVNKYASMARVEKIMNKIQPTIDKKLDFEHTPRVANTCYHDMLTEEIWEIASKVQAVDFKKLKNLSTRKFIQIYHDILKGTISIADQGEPNE